MDKLFGELAQTQTSSIFFHKQIARPTWITKSKPCATAGTWENIPKEGVDGLLTGLTEAQELYFHNKYDGLSESEMNAGLDKLRNRSNRDQLKKYLMQQQLLQQYNVSVSGGTEKFDNYLSLMYEKNNEATIKRGYER